jgi:drug/metabolite transporter (DMT)-like permease
MYYLLLSILTSAAIMIVFKLFDRFKINTSDAIVINYWVAAALSFGLDKSGVSFQGSIHEPWFYNAIFMGVLFITLFNVIGISAQRIGVSVTTVANKMSLIIPVLFAVIVLNESLNWVKIAGIIVALLAVILTSQNTDKQAVDKRYALFPLIVFVGSGFIDAFFKYNEVNTLGKNGLEPFTGWIFLTASMIGFTILLVKFLKTRKLPSYKAAIGGLALGIPNYFSVYFLLKALSMKHMESSVVIPVNNMAIVAIGAIAGVFFFREKMSRINLIGIALCFLAIALIAFSDQFV